MPWAIEHLLVAAVLALALAGFDGLLPVFAESGRAETIAVDDGIAVKESDVATPTRGMTMDQVTSTKFGAPVTKVPAVGQPPISRWEYPGFVVYFEHDHVIHSVIAEFLDERVIHCVSARILDEAHDSRVIANS